MSRYLAMYAHPWDLHEQSIEATENEWSAMGLNTLTVATSYHAGKFIRPRVRKGKVYFPDDGTVYFNPRLERYGLLKPKVNALVERRDSLAEYCQQSDLAVNGWTVLLHNSRLGAEFPQTAVRTIFGDRLHFSLCPSHPEVRKYAVTLCQDLGDRYELAGLCVETPGYLPSVHGYHHEFAQIDQNPWFDRLLGLCVCDACCALARAEGIDAVRLGRYLAKRLHDYLMSEQTVDDATGFEWLLRDVLELPELGAFLRWRCANVTELVAEIRASLRADLSLAVIPNVQQPVSTSWLEGADLGSLATVCDQIEVPFYRPSAASVGSDAWDVLQRLEGGSVVRGILRPGPPDMHSLEQLRASIAVLRSLGIDDLAFYNYGLLRQTQLDWLAAAINDES